MPTIDYPTDIGIANYFSHDVQCHILVSINKFGVICVISSTLLHFSCCKVKKNNSIIKILFHNFHIICYYSKMWRRCRIRTDILPVIRKVSLSYRMRYHLRQPPLFMNKCRTLLLHNQTATFS